MNTAQNYEIFTRIVVFLRSILKLLVVFRRETANATPGNYCSNGQEHHYNRKKLLLVASVTGRSPFFH